MNFAKWGVLALKGCAMGMADVVPGVSGGTIAFISGIYAELIGSIRNIGFNAMGMLFRGQFRDFWRHINGNFLCAVFLGVLVAIFSLARLMTYLLEHHPIEIWSFFFGLIVASSLLVARQVVRWKSSRIASFAVGAIAAYWITVVSPAQTPETWWFIVLSGAVAICAMILPGISGAFILLLMGKYQFIMQALSNLDIGIIVLFGVGAIAGIISFSHLLNWLLSHYHDLTVALLMGFMIGSLNKVWPWKEVLETYTDSQGAVHPLVESNITPGYFEQLTGADPALWQAALLCAAGFLMIWGIEFIGRRLQKKRAQDA